jgi:hypothetical protein
VLLGNGNGTFQPLAYYPQSSQGAPGDVVIADFNNDHIPDLAITVSGVGVEVFLGKGDGTFGAPTTFFAGGATYLLGLDINSDGNIDLVGAAGSSGLAILLGNGNGTFQNVTFPYTNSCVGPLFAGDLTNNGKVDILCGENGQVFLANGDGTFTPVNSGTGGVDALVDMNGDGILDVVTTAPAAPGQFAYSVNLGIGNGTFGPAISLPYPTSTLPGINAALLSFVADMNGDKKPDLIFSNGFPSLFVELNTTPPAPGAQFSPSSVTFAAQAVGTKSAPTTITLTNTGTVALNITSIAITGGDADQFSQTNTCTTVQPTQSCAIKVTFSPTVVGTTVATLSITDNAAGTPQSVSLTGTATGGSGDFSIAPATGSSSSASISAGQSANFSLTVAPVSGFTGTVNLSCSISPLVTPAPTCTLPASVQITNGNAMPVSVTVGTQAAATSGMVGSPNVPTGTGPVFGWVTFVLGGAALMARRKRWLLAFAAPAGLLLVLMMGCGGGSSSSTQTSTGTPAGTYTATVTASSGNLKHSTALTVTVH